MTRQKTFKRTVRERMDKTGESYTAARRILISQGARPDPGAAPAFEPTISDAKLRDATGRGWDEWFALLDAWEGAAHPHNQIARWVHAEHGVPGWWAQTITVGFEQARGLRAPGQRPDGWSVSASKTIATPVERAFDAFDDVELRALWLPHADLRVRTATRPRTARYDWEDGSTRVNVGFTKVGDSRSRVALEHERLPDPETAAEMKIWWRERLLALKLLLEDEAATSTS